jgi:hypothetical protein
MTIFDDTRNSSLKSLLGRLDDLGIAKKHAKELTVVRDHVAACEELNVRALDVRSLTAPDVTNETEALQARLAAGKNVTDDELAALAAKSTGREVGPAAERIVETAASMRSIAARDALRPLFGALIEDLRAIIDGADGVISPKRGNEISTALKEIDKLAGRNVCDYWCLPNYRTGKWDILARDDAEVLNKSNELYAEEQRKKKIEEAANPPVRTVKPKPRRQLSREPRTGGARGGFGDRITQADIDDRLAVMASPELVR